MFNFHLFYHILSFNSINPEKNQPSKFPAFVEDIRKICGTKPIVYKDDSYDAYCVARVLRDMMDTLQDAKHEDIYWAIRQLAKRRDMIVKNNVMNKNQLHSQLSYSYPSYKKFFAQVDGKSALCFWENYPSPEHIWSTTPEQIYKTIKAVHQALKIERVHAIIDMIKKDGNTQKGYQEERDSIVMNIVKDIKNNQELIKDIEVQLRKLLPQTGYKLQTMPGIDLITESKIVSEIGDINRFPDSDKLARFMGLALYILVQQAKVRKKGVEMATES